MSQQQQRAFTAIAFDARDDTRSTRCGLINRRRYARSIQALFQIIGGKIFIAFGLRGVEPYQVNQGLLSISLKLGPIERLRLCLAYPECRQEPY